MNKLINIKGLLIISMAFLTWLPAGISQVDSIHFQFKDTLLKGGTSYTFLISVRESIAEMDGMQFCVGFDDQNITFKSIEKIYIPDWKVEDFSPFPLGNMNMVSSLFIASSPYTGNKLVEMKFDIINDCRTRDVIQILREFRYKPDETPLKSEIYFPTDTKPIATEYLPTNILGNIKTTDIIKPKIYPNPASHRVHLEWNSKELNRDAPVRIFDSSGKLISSFYTVIQAGINTLTLDIDSVGGSAGMYLVEIQNGRNKIQANIQFIR